MRTRTFTMTEFTVTTGKVSKIDVIIDDRKISIAVPTELKAYFNDQFTRPNPTPLQRRKYTTLMALMRAAYVQGKTDAVAAQ